MAGTEKNSRPATSSPVGDTSQKSQKSPRLQSNRRSNASNDQDTNKPGQPSSSDPVRTPMRRKKSLPKFKSPVRPRSDLQPSRRKSLLDYEAYEPSSPIPESRDFDRVVPRHKLKHLDTEKIQQWATVQLPLDKTQIRRARNRVKATPFDYEVLYYEDGYLAIVDAAYKEAKDSEHPFISDTKYRKLSTLEIWRELGLQILGSVPAFLLEAFYSDKSITKHIKDGNELLEKLFAKDSDWVQRYHEAFAACIYAHEFVNKNGDPPTPNQLRKLIEALRGYVSGDRKLHEQNAAIDSLSRDRSDEDDIADGYHAFLRGTEKRVSTLLTFCYALEQQLDQVDRRLNDEPFTAMMYIGFAAVAKARFKDYSEDRSQSWLTGLIKFTCRYLFGEMFDLVQYVICYLTSHEEVQIAEELFTRSARAYSDTGLGFAVASAGVNVSSADFGDLSARDLDSQWAKANRFRNRAYFKENMKRESDRLPQYQRKVKKLIEANTTDRELQKLMAERDQLEAAIRKKKREIPRKETMFKELDSLEKTQKELEESLKDGPAEVLEAVIKCNKAIHTQIKQKFDALSDGGLSDDTETEQGWPESGEEE